ncbi:MAG: T9SS type A sorting domain-containing protein [Bacteroidetes bacterium]|nr:T9SS type A sorting domain-containing protein [Bacteroidota bacterium]
MNRLIPMLAALIMCCTLHAQTLAPNDSVSIGASYSDMTFYNLSTGAKTTASNTDWHLAISVRPTIYPPSGNPQGGVVVRMNEQLGMNIVVAENNDASTFSNLDTTGQSGWPVLHDSDLEWIEGSLNSRRSPSNPFDFGWGAYNQTTHNVMGDSVFIIHLPGGAVKKLIIEGLIKDTAYDIKYANLDNSDLQQVHILKADYSGKGFVYLNLLDNMVHDKEPVLTDWDLQFLKYTGLNIQSLPAYPVTGVWSNPRTIVAEATPLEVNSKDYSGQNFSSDLNTIGWDWKTFAAGGFSVTDSLVYFVKTQQNKYFKMVFTGFSGSTNGDFLFYKEELIQNTGIDDMKSTSWNLYPNPANSLLVISSENRIDEVTIYDLLGNLVMHQSSNGSTEIQLDISLIANGAYLLAVHSEGGVSVKRLVVKH